MARSLQLEFQPGLTETAHWNLCDLVTNSEKEIETAVIISLFTWARARDSDKTDKKYGWWAGEGGSRLYLLSRTPLYPGIDRDAKSYIEEALQWMVDDGVAASIAVETQITQSNGHLYVRVAIARDDGDSLEMKWQNLWEHLR
jgi:phage gp46-like protein